LEITLMTAPKVCPQCQAELLSDVPEGLCPRCLLQGGLGNTAAEPGLKDTTALAPSTLPGVQQEEEDNEAAERETTEAERNKKLLTAIRKAVEAESEWARCLKVLAEKRRLLGELAEIDEELQPKTDESEMEILQQVAIRDLLSRRLPHLEILDRMGQGGMSEVWRAWQPDLDRFLAIKILPPEVDRDPAFAERFNREARALARLNHPHIVSIYDFGEIEGLYFFVMEYLPITLRDLLDSEQFKKYAREPHDLVFVVLREFLTLCEAVEYAHGEGFVHRDIKPENILQCAGSPKLADFGLAKLLAPQAGEGRLTAANQVMGTFRYMAPEQLERPREVDHRADIYALGVVLYEMLTGQLPQGHFEPPSAKVGDVRLDQVVARALARDPEKRYQKVQALKSDLEDILQQPRFFAHLNDATLVVFACMVPLALALFVVWESQKVLPWWALISIPCLVNNRDWYSSRLRNLAYLIWFGCFPVYTLIGPLFGLETAFGDSGGAMTFFIVFMWFNAITDVWALPSQRATRNKLDDLLGRPRAKPIKMPFLRDWVVAVCFSLCLFIYWDAPPHITPWLPFVLSIVTVFFVGLTRYAYETERT
jgi:hypothetical protein